MRLEGTPDEVVLFIGNITSIRRFEDYAVATAEHLAQVELERDHWEKKAKRRNRAPSDAAGTSSG